MASIALTILVVFLHLSLNYANLLRDPASSPRPGRLPEDSSAENHQPLVIDKRSAVEVEERSKEESPADIPRVPFRSRRGFQTDPKLAWDVTQPIPYFFDPSLSSSTIAMIKKGLEFWANNSCVSFVEDPKGASALRFYSGPACFADRGRQGKKTQEVSIGIGCESMGTVTHEINHAMGFFHTMSRPDREKYVTLNAANIQSELAYNFVLNAPGADESFGVGFDYGSVMLYNQYAFAKNMSIPTINATNPYYQSTMGQRSGPAFSDVKLLNKAYKCEALCPRKSCSNGGIANPNNCATCLCPRSFGGPSCTDLPKATAPVCNGGVLQASSTWQTLNGRVGTDDWEAYETTTECFWHIKAPPGRNVSLRLSSPPSSCVSTCTWQGLEMTLGDFDLYGITMCCPEFVGKQFTSSGSVASIRGFSRSNLAVFSVDYKIY